MNPAKTPNGGRPIAASAKSENKTANSRHRRGKPADGLRVHVVPVPRADDLPSKQESARCECRGTQKDSRLRGDGTRTGHKPPEDGEEREAAVGQEQSYARLRQRLDRTVKGAHQR